MKTTLYYREGSSDKIYQAAIEPQEGGYVVNFAYGRRGATLTTGTKTTAPMSLLEATEIFNRLVLSKTAKGYTPGEDGTPYTAPTATRTSDRTVLPQLLNSIDESEINALLANPNIVLQEKHDGRRMLLRKTDGVVTAFNKKGQPAGLPAAIHDKAISLEGNFLMDGEAVGDVFHAFDLLEWDGADLRNEPYRNRIHRLIMELPGSPLFPIRVVDSRGGDGPAKRLFLDTLRLRKAEGVVFKRLDAKYTSGRPASGGDQLKFKFVQSASVLVAKVNAKRSVRIALYRGQELIPAGNVTIPANQPIPKVGDVAEVRYLYAMRESGALYQPVYLGARDDVDAAECLADQLKYKAA